jgi:flagellar biosynthesis protein FlhG
MGSSQINSSEFHSSTTRTISVTSGKGGVGKTSIVVNLAKTLNKRGYRVLILDGDLGMANVDIMLNVRARRNIYDLISGEAQLSEILVEVENGLTLIPGGSGLYELQKLSVFERQLLLDQVSTLGQQYDYMLIDTSPGIDNNVLYLNAAAQEICVVVNPDPSSFADSYALIKVLNQRCRENRFSIICNQVRDEQEGAKLFRKLDDVVQKFLYVSLDYKGSIPSDLNLRQATKNQQLVTQVYPNSQSSLALSKLAQKFESYQALDECKGNLQFFWEQLVGVA